MNESDKVSLLASINIGVGGLFHWAEKLEPLFRSLATLGQLGIAALTLVYIWNKVKRSNKRRRK